MERWNVSLFLVESFTLKIPDSHSGRFSMDLKPIISIQILYPSLYGTPPASVGGCNNGDFKRSRNGRLLDNVYRNW